MSPRGKQVVTGVTISVILAGCGVWYAVNPQSATPKSGTVGRQPDTARLSCGPTALMTIASAHDAGTVARLGQILESHELATRPVTSLYDLAACAKRAGLHPIGLEVEPRHLQQLPLPAVVHVKPDHFLALVQVSNDWAVVIDQGVVKREIPRRDFDRRFSGYVLCLQKRHTVLGQSVRGEGTWQRAITSFGW